MIGLRRPIRYRLPRPVVKDVAVLQDFDEGGPRVLVGPLQGVLEVLDLHVDAPGDERRLRPQGDLNGTQRIIERSEGGGLGHLPELRRRRVLPFRQAVDPVVEEENLNIDVPAQGMDQVVSADAQPVPVSGDHPDVQLRPADLEAGGNGRGTAVNRVKPIGVHVVGEAAGAADSGDKDQLRPINRQLGQHLLHLGQDRVGPAARAPPDLLVRHEILSRQFRRWDRDLTHRYASTSSCIRSMSSPTLKGCPWILFIPMASTRYSARMIFKSWPMFNSGTRTL